MQERATRIPRLRKIDVRVPILRNYERGRDAPVLDELDRLLLRRVDGRASVHDLAISIGRSEEEVASALARLEELRCVAIMQPASGLPSSPPTRLQSGLRPATRPGPFVPSASADGAAGRVIATPPREPPPLAPVTVTPLATFDEAVAKEDDGTVDVIFDDDLAT
jgi:hypothetical protein